METLLFFFFKSLVEQQGLLREHCILEMVHLTCFLVCSMLKSCYIPDGM